MAIKFGTASFATGKPKRAWRGCRYESRRWVVNFAVVAIGATSGCAEGAAQPYVRLDQPAPQIASAPAARALLVSFWAAWCAPCREETPELQALATRPPRGLAVMVFSHDATMSAVETFFGGSPDPALHLRLDADLQLARAMNVETLPSSILIVEGRMVARFDGRRRWSSTAERALLTRLIDE